MGSFRIMNAEGRHTGLSAEQKQNMSQTDKPAPLVHRNLVREVQERIDHNGQVIVPLDEEGVRLAVHELLDQGVEAFAVSLLWSFRRPTHELAIESIINEMAPGIYVGLSSSLSPRIREYSRSVTTIMSTQVAPRLRAYLEPLSQDLANLNAYDRLTMGLTQLYPYRFLHMEMHSRIAHSDGIKNVHDSFMSWIRNLVYEVVDQADAGIDRRLLADVIVATFEGARAPSETQPANELIPFILQSVLPGLARRPVEPSAPTPS